MVRENFGLVSREGDSSASGKEWLRKKRERISLASSAGGARSGAGEMDSSAKGKHGSRAKGNKLYVVASLEANFFIYNRRRLEGRSPASKKKGG